MADDFHCDEVLSGRTSVHVIAESARVMASRHTRPSWPAHVVVIPKRHIASLVAPGPDDDDLLIELLAVVRQVAAAVLEGRGACRIVTNLGAYQESKHLRWHVYAGDRLLPTPRSVTTA